ncbi:hypothetical protein Patl1_03334 [Pistacia atlantica]|uniref:Uncharacterized protein n=1 Tax=Pistacia atlantica TaxID=434234 RepID=A0ACC1C7X6_9ROSI|nr:hypothetical protein Patl1_03334 [Pistacia atlantica]
MWDIVPRIRY